MSRRVVRFLSGLVCLCLSVLSHAADKKPNVLFIAVDDMRAWTHYLGDPQVITPNFDRLAKMGVSFTRSYSASVVCNPSRTALLTGRRPGTTGVYLNATDWRAALPGTTTIPGHFKKNGYEVYGAGKIFHGSYVRASDWDFFAADGEGEGGPAGRNRDRSDEPKPEGSFVVNRNTVTPLDGPDSDLPDYRNADWVIDRINEGHDLPMFLAYGIHKPHPLFEVPRKYFEMYPVDKIILPEVLDNDRDDLPPAGVQMAGATTEHDDIIAAGKWKEMVQAYLACITFADVQLGRVLDALEASAIKDNTIIVLWSDHGWHHGEKQHWHKFTLWEEATRAPLIWVVPGVTKPGSVCERTVDHMHIFPTLCAVTGMPQPEGIEGKNIRALLAKPDAAWDTPAVSSYKFGNHAVRNERWRYIRYNDGGEELYDHETDPHEWNNLASNEKFEPIKTELAKWVPTVNTPDRGNVRPQ